jgi:hypothetical protein
VGDIYYAQSTISGNNIKCSVSVDSTETVSTKIGDLICKKYTLSAMLPNNITNQCSFWINDAVGFAKIQFNSVNFVNGVIQTTSDFPVLQSYLFGK